MGGLTLLILLSPFIVLAIDDMSPGFLAGCVDILKGGKR